MPVLRTAIAGLGRVAWDFHLPNITGRPAFDLKAIVDPIKSRRADTQKRFGDVPGYATISDMLNREDIDLLVIATPTHLHADHVKAAFASNVDVLLEKPMAATLAEAEAIVALARKMGRRLMVFQPHRCTRQTSALRSLLASGRLGQLYQVELNVCRYVRRNDWQAQRKFGGGMLNNYGAHFLDLLMSLTSFDCRLMSCNMLRLASIGDADDIVRAELETEAGVSLHMHINMACALPKPFATLFGTCGTAIMDAEREHITCKWFDPAELQPLRLQSRLAAEGRSYGNNDVIPWKEERLDVGEHEAIDFYANVASYFTGASEPLVPMEQTLTVMRMMAACRQLSGWDA